MKKFKTYYSKNLDSFETSDLNNGRQSTLNSRVKLAFRISIIGALTFLFFSIVYFFRNNHFSAYVNLIFCFATILNLLLLRKSKNIDFPFTAITIITFLALVYIFVTGGIGGNGLLWFESFPVIIFFLNGKKRGAMWLGLLLITISVLSGLSTFNIIHIPFAAETVAILVLSLTVLAALVLSYEDVNDNYEKLMNDNNKELMKSAEQLIHEVEEKKKTEKRLDLVIKEMGQKNELLEDTKKAMLNLLEDLRNAKGNVEQEKAKDDAILSSIGDGLIVTDENGLIQLLNKPCIELLGWDENMIGKNLYDVLPVEDDKANPIEKNSTPLYKALTTGKKISESNYLFVKEDKTKFPVNVTASPVMLEDRTVGAIMVFRDITKEKEIDKAKTEFVSLASHQLRTPLTAINWYVEMLIDGDAGNISEEQKSFLEEIYHGNQRMVELVNALLNVSRIDLGTFAVDPKPVNLIEVADSVLDEMKPQIEKKKTNIIKNYSEIPILNADPQLIRIVFQNLLTNAVKYTPNEGTVTVSMNVEDDHVLVNVKDTGYGIPKRQQGKIFTKLFRADNAVEKETDGTGLGLYIVKSIVEQSKGKIWFESEENKGTTFFVTIPLEGMKKKDGSKGLS